MTRQNILDYSKGREEGEILLKKYTPFLIFWALDSALLYLAAMFFPAYYVLGNSYFNMALSAVVAGGVWTVIVWNSMPLTKKLGIKATDMVKNILFWLVVNFVALWVIARFSLMLGFGVTSFVWVFALAFVANILQWLGWSVTSKKK